MLPHTKNPNYIPSYYTKVKPFSFTFYNPYTNTIPNSKKENFFNTCNINQTNLSKKLDANKCFPYYFCFCAPQSFECKETKCNYSVLNDISQDSAICMHDNLYDSSSLPDESCNTSEFSIEQTDSGIDMSLSKLPSDIVQTNGARAVQQSNFLATSTMLNMHSISSSSLLYDDKKISTSLFNSISSFNTDDENVCTSELCNFKSSTLCKKKVTRHVNKQCSNRKTHLLKFCKNTQCTQNPFFFNKKIVIPKRYIKWRRAKSCITIHKVNSPHKFKFKRVRSHPSLLRQSDPELRDSIFYDSATPVIRNKSLNSSILTKLSHFSPIFKQYILNPCNQIPETYQRQKYTPLPSPLPIPAKVAKLSNSEHDSRSTFTSNESYSNISSKNYITKGDQTKSDKQKDKALTLVLSLFF
ncbi:uncharacterized protein LOC143423158 [Xylocopa sonorina]|uniref:uncharacterized protein LOC143423158 n=1 Tax=Xylocopa sonorina TaxID=1818115 RepID=UPI00403B05F7